MQPKSAFDKKKLTAFAALAMMFAGDNNNYDMSLPTEQPKKRMLSIPNPVPKGHKEFFLDKDGNETRLKSETIFYCTALNYKNAIRKFKKHTAKPCT
jgi:hypothetical protein